MKTWAAHTYLPTQKFFDNLPQGFHQVTVLRVQKLEKIIGLYKVVIKGLPWVGLFMILVCMGNMKTFSIFLRLHSKTPIQLVTILHSDYRGLDSDSVVTVVNCQQHDDYTAICSSVTVLPAVVNGDYTVTVQSPHSYCG